MEHQRQLRNPHRNIDQGKHTECLIMLGNLFTFLARLSVRMMGYIHFLSRLCIFERPMFCDGKFLLLVLYIGFLKLELELVQF